MEMLGAFLDEEWESLSQMFSSSESHDFSLHFHGSSSSLFSSNDQEIPSPPLFFPSHHQTNFSCISQESSDATDVEESLFLNIQENEHQHQNFNDGNTFNNFLGMDFNNAAFMLSDAVMEEFLRSKVENRPLETADSCQIKRKSDTVDVEMQDHDKSEDHAPMNPKKKPRLSRNAQKNKTAQSKKGKKIMQDKNNEEENNGGNKQSCSSFSSEDDSNASQEMNEEIENSNAKTRASRGSATDPQSLYARRRRERINERLKILQNLVPNGTKVDISTMLEEAVQYVKFLQLQIKLLSSDNLWMYAPLAYNGMDIGMYQKICPNLN